MDTSQGGPGGEMWSLAKKTPRVKSKKSKAAPVQPTEEIVISEFPTVYERIQAVWRLEDATAWYITFDEPQIVTDIVQVNSFRGKGASFRYLST